ncbi:hypothetical protein CRG98_023934, partial [Punica granatum]
MLRISYGLARASLSSWPSLKPRSGPALCGPKSRALWGIRSSSAAAYTTSSSSGGKLLFRQLFEEESYTYTYLLADVSHPDKPAV